MIPNTLLLLAAYATPILGAAISLPSVTLNTNQVITGITEGNVETFKGIPFAEPPLGNLRFKKPADYTGSYQGLAASDYKPGCMGIDPSKIISSLDNIVNFSQILPDFAKTPFYDFLHGSLTTSEDCLYVNVLRPVGTKPTDKLPVMAWIYGGAFLWGTTGQYPGNGYVEQSVAMGQPVVFVSIAYRLGPYGFMGGDALAEEGSTNAGLHDQRKGLEWIQDHIAEFGGDPDNVMLFGESAGAMSVAHQLIAYGGDNSYKSGHLFHSAILQSGGPLPLQNTTSRSPQVEFERFSDKCGCSGLGNEETLACIRSKDVSVLSAAENSYGPEDLYGLLYMFLGYTPRPDGDIIPDDAYTLYQQNKVAQVPLISGSMEDEGTLFAFTCFNSTTTADVKKWMKYILNEAADSSINNILSLYSALPSEGAPYRTGLLNALTLQYKRIASILTDLLFSGPRRTVMENSVQKRWSYFATHFHDLVPFLGTFHGSDLIFQWYVDNIGPHLAFRNYFIAFANHKDPNVGSTLTYWDAYTNDNKNSLEITLVNQVMGSDDFRTDSVNYFMTQPDLRG